MEPFEARLYYTALIAVIMLVLLVPGCALLLLYQQKKQYLKLEQFYLSEIELLEKERQRIASDLHDQVGAHIHLGIRQLEHTRNNSQAPLPLLEEALVHIKNVQKEMINIVKDLDDERLQLAGLENILRQLLATYSPLLHIRFHFRATTSLSPAITIHFYRIVKELLSNTMRHATATMLELHIIEREDKLFLFFRDNGNGWQGKTLTGNGIQNIQKRVHLLGGTLSIKYHKEPSFFITINHTTAPP